MLKILALISIGDRKGNSKAGRRNMEKVLIAHCYESYVVLRWRRNIVFPECAQTPNVIPG
jgi:hypothetical protein